ncbi:MAG: peptidylprolyl isomerase, partial [Pseudomonadota bacterium]
MTTSLLAAAALLLSFAIPAMAGPKVKFETTMGAFVIEVNEEKAPITAANFLAYVDEGFYDGVVFHRVIPNFMAQGGGFAAEAGMYVEKPTRDPIQNEADNGLRNVKGSVAMARTSDPHSASAQFFVNFKDNDFLDHTAKTPRGWGYAVFGQVVEGMDVVEKMAFQGTGD